VPWRPRDRWARYLRAICGLLERRNAYDAAPWAALRDTFFAPGAECLFSLAMGGTRFDVSPEVYPVMMARWAESAELCAPAPADALAGSVFSLDPGGLTLMYRDSMLLVEWTAGKSVARQKGRCSISSLLDSPVYPAGTYLVCASANAAMRTAMRGRTVDLRQTVALRLSFAPSGHFLNVFVAIIGVAAPRLGPRVSTGALMPCGLPCALVFFLSRIARRAS